MASKEYVVKRMKISDFQIILEANESCIIKVTDNAVCFFEIGDKKSLALLYYLVSFRFEPGF